MEHLMPKHEFDALTAEEQRTVLYTFVKAVGEEVERPRPINWKMVGPAIALITLATGLVTNSLSKTSDAISLVGAQQAEVRDQILLRHETDVAALQAADKKLEIVDAGAVVWREQTERSIERIREQNDQIRQQNMDILNELRDLRKEFVK